MSQQFRVATLGDVPPGTCLHVDAGGLAVVVLNVDGTIYAIGGTCTHVGGPLGEGELEGTVITCPWHGAQFDVTTGQVVGPPAEMSVPTYGVVIEGENIDVYVA